MRFSLLAACLLPTLPCGDDSRVSEAAESALQAQRLRTPAFRFRLDGRVGLSLWAFMRRVCGRKKGGQRTFSRRALQRAAEGHGPARGHCQSQAPVLLTGPST